MQIYPTALDYRRAEEEGGNPLDYAIQRKRLRLEDYVTERPVNSLERQRAIQEEAEQTRARALLDVWELPVRRFLSQLFNKGTRSRNIIQRWFVVDNNRLTLNHFTFSKGGITVGRFRLTNLLQCS